MDANLISPQRGCNVVPPIWRQLGLLSAVVGVALFSAAPAAAAPEPVLKLDIHHSPTNFAPGGSPGILTATTSTQGSPFPARGEVQEILVAADAGSFHLAFQGDVTPDLPYA